MKIYHLEEYLFMIYRILHKNRWLVVYTAFLSLILFNSCINDDLSNCPVPKTQLNITFTYTTNEHAKDLFEDEIDHLDLYFYDHQGDFFKKHSLDQDTLIQGNRLALELDPGEYSVVIWGNAHNPKQFGCNIPDRIEKMELKAMTQTDGGMPCTSAALFHGLYNLKVESNKQTQDHYIDLTKNTHDIRVLLKIINSPTPVKTGDYIVDISGQNGAYLYNNQTSNVYMSSVPEYAIVGKDSLMAQSRTLRIDQGDDMKIAIKDTKTPAQVYFDRSLSDDLMLDPRIIVPQDFDRIHEFLLVYEIKYEKDGSTSIDVNVGYWDGGNIDVPLW